MAEPFSEQAPVFIAWEDSYGVSSSWQSLDDIDLSTPLMIYSVGWVVAENEERLVLVPHLALPHKHTDGQQGCGDMTIPKSAIRLRKTLEGK